MNSVVSKLSQVSSNAIVIAAASLASRILGLFRDRVLASEFGAGQTLDTYYAAFRLPDLIFNLLILGALSSAFIPVFSELIFKNKKKAWEVVNNFINISFLIIIISMAIFFIFAPWIMKIITPGFNTVQLEDVTLLTRIMLLSPLLFAISSVMGGVLNSFGRFLVYSIAPILYNVGIICGALYLVPTIGMSGLAWGVILGALAHMLVQVPTFFKVGFRFQRVFNFRDEYFLKIIKLMMPVTMGLALVQINLIVDNLIGSTIEHGSIAIINLSTNIISLPVGLIGISFAVSSFPTLSHAYSQRKEEMFIKHFTGTFKMLVYLLIPSMVLFLLLRAQIVRLILGAGLFDIENTIWTSRALGYLAIGLVAQGMIPFLTRAFYSAGDTKTPVKIVFIAFLVNALGSILFTKVVDFKVVGLALSTTIAAFVNFLFLLIILKEKFSKIDFTRMFKATTLFFVFSIVAGLSTYFSLRLFEPLIDNHTTIGLLIQTTMAGGVGCFVYLLLSAIFKIDEAYKLTDGLTVIIRRVLRRC